MTLRGNVVLQEEIKLERQISRHVRDVCQHFTKKNDKQIYFF